MCESLGLAQRRCSMNICCIWIWNQLQETGSLKGCEGVHSETSEVLLCPAGSQPAPDTESCQKTKTQQLPLKGWQSRGGNGNPCPQNKDASGGVFNGKTRWRTEQLSEQFRQACCWGKGVKKFVLFPLWQGVREAWGSKNILSLQKDQSSGLRSTILGKPRNHFLISVSSSFKLRYSNSNLVQN